MNVKFCAVLEVKGFSLNQATYAGILPKPFHAINPDNDIFNYITENPIIYIEKNKKLEFIFSGMDLYLITSLTRNNNLLAVLLLGHPLDSGELMPEDVGLLEILARQGAIAIENNNYIEETKQLTQKVTEAEIQKKYVKELEEKNKKLQKLYQELKETQSQLIQSEKMASLGQLVAGVAHELNNPISFVYANMKELEIYIGAVEEILKTVLENSGKNDIESKIQEMTNSLQSKYDLNFIQNDIEGLIKESIEGSQRVKTVVENLRNFSRIDEGEFKAVDLHQGLDSTLMLLNNEIKNRIQIHRNYGNLPKFECHPSHINQVFMNLLLNAVQAIEGKGNIWIETSCDNHFIYIKISDDGRGIPNEVQGKIFDPFFTTKPVGEGTGLGLSVSYGIIEKHKGSIQLESKAGEGTEFLITLPLQTHSLKNV
jgi:signal transduction histidine kinase